MKLVTFRLEGSERVGMVARDGASAVDLTSLGLAENMLDLVENFTARRERVLAAMAVNGIPLGDVKILAPIPVPRRNIFCVGKNYHEHAAEFGRSGFDGGSTGGDEVPEFPIIFTKPPSSVIGPDEAIQSGLDPCRSVDYEAELGIVIGRTGRVEESDDPWSFVFGYTIINDVTSRELQKRHKQWALGKGIDTFGPMGPSIVTVDDIEDLQSTTIKLWVNGELRQSATISDLIFDIPTLVRTIGRSITLQAGDVIATGTPAGVGIGFKPPRYLRSGDIVHIEIPPIGILENPVS